MHILAPWYTFGSGATCLKMALVPALVEKNTSTIENIGTGAKFGKVVPPVPILKKVWHQCPWKISTGAKFEKKSRVSQLGTTGNV